MLQFTMRPSHLTQIINKSSYRAVLARPLSTKSSFTVNMPTPESKSWERSAKLVKNTDTSNNYLEHIRQTHDPALQLKTLEDELKGTMGKALGKQGDKVLNLLKQVHEERKKVEHLLVSENVEQQDLQLNQFDTDSCSDDVREQSLRLSEETKKQIYVHVQKHNQIREKAVHARWELLVHRQAIGFITQNHKFVNEMFQIPDKMTLPGNINDWKEYDGRLGSTAALQGNQQVAKEKVTRNFGDQLDWWERIGRWR
jgi:ribosome-binding ATPase YchF (GTP1/OBG family)